MACAPRPLPIPPEDAARLQGLADNDTTPDGDVAPADHGDSRSPPSADADAPRGDAEPRPTLPRGLRWVRGNPMFVSALTVNMGPPPAEFVRAYYDDFGASAAHLWATGLPHESAGWMTLRPQGRFLSWVAPDGTSYAGGGLLGGQLPALAGRIGYQIGDEPGVSCDNDTPCALAELAAMERGVNAVRAADPEALIVLNFNMGGYTDAVVSRYAAIDGDVVSYDHYSRDDGAYEALELFRAAGLSQSRPYWRYIKSYYQASGDETLTESDLRWDAFSGLVYGYSGHTWFLYTISDNADLDPALFTRESDFAAPPTPAFAIVAELNRQLARYGRVISQLTSTDVRYRPWLPFLQPEGTRNWSRGAGGDPYLAEIGGAHDLALGFFTDDRGERYVMVQNVAHTHGTWPTDHENAITTSLLFDFSGAPAELERTRLVALNAETGEPMSVALIPDGGRARLGFRLEAGGALLFKYANGRSMAGF